ncbi:MAG: asparagine synthase (glutamine-hydrolyzing) [Sporocytophaga sp.]|uniref:asparagine synthase (glutamine-hydrolyzing) n=1 Tax=Sporocytophaga sp. TaxID=2231183 RepID=UPI001AFF1BF1|nr:asparagine synthase (glutamine-hydrolyzing) [Sporocytophaga sp.]MBO9698585.1 asparagine synthase (glutamine-hydrolyzing) [Sporocytophaga sp.]
MCGINVIVDKTRLLDDSHIKKMNAATVHRGPDHSGVCIFRNSSFNIFLGNNRLKVTDPLSRADQPMVSADQNYAISYNGEVYNFKSLKSAILNDFSFKTDGDTETVFFKIIKNGIQAANEFHGMFAFAFYDHAKETISICRDERGIKPMYYFEDEKYFIASSEIKGILATGLIRKELNDKEIYHYLHFKYAQRPNTIFKNIFELEPGTFLRLNNHFQKDSLPYKQNSSLGSSFKKQQSSREEIIEKSEELIQQAIREQTYSSGPSGIFLSGGVDSTLLLAFSKELYGNGVKTYSIVNSKEEAWAGTEDFSYSRLAAKKYQAEHTEVQISSDDLGRLDEIIQKLDQPIADSALLLTYLISEKASEDVKVILSGAGADEVFAGYNRHKAFSIYLKYFRSSAAIHTGHLLGEIHSYKSKSLRLISRFLNDIDQDPQTTFFNFSNLKFRDFLRLQEFREVWNKEQLLDSALNYDKNYYLVNDILSLTDQMTMAHCLEARVPYLDKNIVAWSESLGANALLRNGTKWILKELLQRKDGVDFVKRKKEGFGLPLKSWFEKGEGKNLLDQLKEKNQLLYRYFPYYKVDQMIEHQERKTADFTGELWALIVLSRWLKFNFE